MNFIEKIKIIVRGSLNLNRLEKDGFIHGENFNVMGECIIDPGHCWLIKIGDNVTLAPRVHILAHDASTKAKLGYTKIKNVTIGNNVFIGAGTIILPGVNIGDDVIIGAGSVVANDLKSNGVYVGNPARLLMNTEEYINKEKEKLKNAYVYDGSYTYFNISNDKKKEMRKQLNKKEGYII